MMKILASWNTDHHEEKLVLRTVIDELLSATTRDINSTNWAHLANLTQRAADAAEALAIEQNEEQQ